MIGVDDKAEFPSQTIEVAPQDQLFVYSDGAFEVEKGDGTMWTLREFLEVLGRGGSSSESRIDRLLDYTRQLQGGDDFADDFSIVQVVF
jgi:sigma-B regulation protein RsbU (phosphoserine phosphatase)